MNVRLDQTGAGEASAGVVGFARTANPRRNRDDLAIGDTYVDRLLGRPIGEAGIRGQSDPCYYSAK